MTLPTWLLVLFSSAVAVLGQLCLKAGMNQIGPIGVERILTPVPAIIDIITTRAIVVGLGFYVISALAWLVVLSHLRLSHAYPFLGLNFLLITLASWLFLGERVPTLRWVGVLVISLGMLIVSRG